MLLAALLLTMGPDNRQNKNNAVAQGACLGGSKEISHQVAQYLTQHQDLNSFEPSATGYTTLGIIIATIPFSNMYLVCLAGTGNEKKMALSTYVGSNRLNGVNSVNYFLPGTYVSLFVKGTDTDAKKPPFTILGTVDPLVGLDDNVHHVFDTPSEFLSHSGTAATKSLETQISNSITKDSVQKANYNYGKPMDSIAGEHVIYNVFGGGLLVTDFMTVLKGSEGARIEAYMFDDTIRITAKQYLLQNAMYDERLFFKRYGISRMRSMAMTLAEGIGSLDGTTRLVDAPTDDNDAEDRIHRTDLDTIGYFNYNHIEGNLGDGSYEYITYPPKGTSLKADTVLPPGLLSVEKGYDGSFKVKAAREISLQKTMYVVAPKEIKQANDNSLGRGTDIREDWDTNHTSTETLGVLGTQFTQERDKFQIEHALGDMRKENDCWIIPDKAQVYAAFNAATGASFEENPELAELPADQPHYVTPARKIPITPFTREGKRDVPFNVYDTTSGIEQLPDGSVVIHGGYGEEIKMFKGNIYITCPGDIIYQSGRDIVSMAPRHNVIKADTGSLEMTSNTGASLVSKGNLQICAASSGEKGTLIIENKSPLDMDLSTFEEGMGLDDNKASGGGIIVKSQTRASILGRNTYMGSGNSFAGSTAEVDAENTEFHSTYHKHYVTGTLSLLNSQGAAITVSGSNIELLSSGGITVGGQVSITSTFENMEFLSREGESTSTVITSGSPQLQVNGGITANGSILASGVATPYGGELAKVDTASWATFTKGILKEANINTSKNVPSVSGLASTLSSDDQSMADLDRISTIMPSTAAYRTANFYFPFSTWQSILTGGSLWAESTIKGSFNSMTFPGFARWGESGSLKGLKDSNIENKTLSSDYKINC